MSLFKRIYLLFFISLILILSGCKNFLNGSDIITTLEETIKYENAVPFQVILETDSEYGKLSDSGNHTVKETDKLSLSFEIKNDKYVFLGWTCVDSNTGKDLSSNVVFEDILSPKTTVEFLNAGEITIKPKCAERPYVKNFSPTYDQTGVGVAKNTSIIIELAQKIETSETEDILNKIIIESNGSITSKFSPSMSEKIITIVSKELIDLKNGTQDVTVKVPGSYYYTTKDVKGNNVKVYLSPAYNGENEVYDAHSYLINSTTSEKTEIYFSVDTELGKLDFTGQKTLNVGDEFQVTFTNNKGYSFKNWNITADGYTEEELKTSLGIETSDNSDSGKYTIYGTVTKSIKGIKIFPICNELPTVKDYTPKMEENGVLQDSSIKIYFSKPINLADFYTKETGFKNLSIMAGGVEVACNSDSSKNRFSSANYTETKNADGETVYVLTLLTDKNKLLISSTNANEKLDVIVTVYTKTNKIKDSSEAPELFTDDITWSYRVKNVRDGEAPTNFSINVYNDENCTKELYSDCFDSNGNIFDNNHVNKIYIKAEAKDNTGVAGLYVTEKYLKDRDGNTQDQNNPNNSKSYLVGTDELKQDSKDKNKYTLFIPYVFNNPNDGEYEIIFSMVDYAENHSEEKSVTLIKDTINTCEFNIVSGMEINFPSGQTQWVSGSTISKTNLVAYSKNNECVINIVGIEKDSYFEQNPSSDKWYSNKSTSYENLNWTVFYDYDTNYSNKIEITKFSEITISTQSPEKNLYINLVSEDMVGNTTELKTIIPQKPNVKKDYLKRGSHENGKYVYADNGETVILCVETEPLLFSDSDRYNLFVYTSNTEDNYIAKDKPSSSNIYETSLMSYEDYKTNYIDSGKDIEFYCFWGKQQNSAGKTITTQKDFSMSLCGFVSECRKPIFVTSDDNDPDVPEIPENDISFTIESNGINSESHKINVSCKTDYLYDDIILSWEPLNGYKTKSIYFERFDEDPEKLYRYELTTDIPTEVFFGDTYTTRKNRVDYTFNITARKGVTEKVTPLTIKSDNENIKDNLPPNYSEIAPSYTSTTIGTTTSDFNLSRNPKSNYIYVGIFSDTNSDIKKGNDGATEITVYYAPLEDRWKYSEQDGITPEKNNYLGAKVIEKGLITEQYISDNFSKFKTTVTYGANSPGVIDLSRIEDGDYLICASATDTEGNFKIVPLRYYFKHKLDLPEISVSIDSSKKLNNVFVCKLDGKDSDKKTTNFLFNSHIIFDTAIKYIYDFSSQSLRLNETTQKYEWQTINGSNEYNNYYIVNSNNQREITMNSIPVDDTKTNNVHSDEFIRVNMLKNYCNPISKKNSYYHCSKDISLYRYYYMGIKMEDNQVKDDDGNPITITADMLDTARGGMIYSSHPCIIETVYSSKDWGNDPDEWEYHVPDSQKVNIVVFKPTAEKQQYLYSINKTEDMEGKYCRVLVHFADGTSVLSSLK